MFSRFDAVPDSGRQTDGQTDSSILATTHLVMYIASRVKNEMLTKIQATSRDCVITSK